MSSCTAQADKAGAAKSPSALTVKTAAGSSGLHPAFTKKDPDYGYIDDSGRFVIKQQFSQAGEFNADGLSIVATGRNYGVIDKNGKYVLPPVYQGISDFSGGVAVLQKGTKQGLADESGKVLVNAVYNAVLNYSEGLAVAQNDTIVQSKYDYVSYAFDKTGKLVFKINGMMGSFHNGLATLRDNASQLYGYVNETGKITIAPQFIEADDFRNGTAQVMASDRKTYDIDNTGKQIKEVTAGDQDANNQYFDDGYSIKTVYNIVNSSAGIPEEKGSGNLYDKSGRLVIKGTGIIKRIDSDYFAVGSVPSTNIGPKINGIPWAIFSKGGKRLTDYIYYGVSALNDGTLAVYTYNSSYLLSSSLNEIKGFKRLDGKWTLSSSGSLVKAVLYGNIRYYTGLGALIFSSDSPQPIRGGADIGCAVYAPSMLISNVYPQLSLMKDTAVQNRINLSLQKHFEDKTPAADTRNYQNLNFSYDLIANVLHISAKGSFSPVEFSMEGGGEKYAEYYYDLNTGAEYTLDSLFKPGSGYQQYIENGLKTGLKNINGVVDSKAAPSFDAISGFLVFKDKIQIYQYYFSLMGTPLYTCDFTYSQLDGYLDKNGGFWKAIQQYASGH